MIRKLIDANIELYPESLRGFLDGAKIYDSSCSPFAKVIFIDKDNGYYLKCSDKYSLEKEAKMTDYFARKNLAANVVCYISDEKDWLMTERVEGEDCTYGEYIAYPEKLCDTLALTLRWLHEMSFEGCPIPDRNKDYLNTVERNCEKGIFDDSFIADSLKKLDKRALYRYIMERKGELKKEVLLHGDYCLPNVILNNFKFSGFIDLDGAGVGDRHIDLFWGAWTLNFNLKTDKYRDRFFDAYGRDKIDEGKIELISACEAFG